MRTNIKYQEEFRNAGLLIFTETWWDGDTPKDCINLNGFSKPFRTDRDLNITGKKGGGDVAIYYMPMNAGVKRRI